MYAQYALITLAYCDNEHLCCDAAAKQPCGQVPVRVTGQQHERSCCCGHKTPADDDFLSTDNVLAEMPEYQVKCSADCAYAPYSYGGPHTSRCTVSRIDRHKHVYACQNEHELECQRYLAAPDNSVCSQFSCAYQTQSPAQTVPAVKVHHRSQQQV